jgi:hypothetical protein
MLVLRVCTLLIIIGSQKLEDQISSNAPWEYWKGFPREIEK